MALRKVESELNPVAQEAPVVENHDVQGEVTPHTGTQARTKDKAKASYYQNFKNEGLKLMKEEAATGEAAVAGSMSDKVAFLFPLGNPTKVGTRTEKGQSEIPTIEIIGYMLKALADIEVPVIDRTDLAKVNVMGAKSVTWVPVKKNSNFILTRAELGEMITKIEYNGMFTGDPKNIVELQVTISKVAGNNYAPLTILKKTQIPGVEVAPIKQNIVPVAVKKDGAEGNGIKDYTVLPEYAEKFGYLFEEVRSAGRASGPREYQKRAQGQSAAELAAAMRAFQKNTQRAQ